MFAYCHALVESGPTPIAFPSATKKLLRRGAVRVLTQQCDAIPKLAVATVAAMAVL